MLCRVVRTIGDPRGGGRMRRAACRRHYTTPRACGASRACQQRRLDQPIHATRVWCKRRGPCGAVGCVRGCGVWMTRWAWPAAAPEPWPAIPQRLDGRVPYQRAVSRVSTGRPSPDGREPWGPALRPRAARAAPAVGIMRRLWGGRPAFGVRDCTPGTPAPPGASGRSSAPRGGDARCGGTVPAQPEPPLPRVVNGRSAIVLPPLVVVEIQGVDEIAKQRQAFLGARRR